MSEVVHYELDGKWRLHSELHVEDDNVLWWTGKNYLPNSDFTTGWLPIYGGTVLPGAGPWGENVLSVPPTTSYPNGRYPYLGSITQTVAASHDPNLTVVEPGERVKVSLWFSSNRPLSAAAVGFGGRVKTAGTPDLAWSHPATIMNTDPIPPNTWTRVEGEVTIPRGRDRLAFGIRLSGHIPDDATILVASPTLDKQTPSTLMENGVYTLTRDGREVPVVEEDGVWTIGWDAPEDMTLNMWNRLPEKYREADIALGRPLFRWLTGVGHLQTRVREVSDAVYSGTLTDPRLTIAPRWIAQLLGLDVSNLSAEEARTAVSLRISGGASMVGTREHIGRVAASVLGSSAQLAVVPDPEQPFIIYILTDEHAVTDAGGLDRVRSEMRKLQSVPAGHVIVPVVAQATWGEFDAAKGTTWQDYMDRIRNWADHDSLGVSLD